MSKGLIFFCCACCILLLTIVNLSIGPNISGKLGDLGTLNCAKAKDVYDRAKDDGVEGDELKYGPKWELDNCQRLKGMYDMEYTSFIFDVAIGFVCGLMGLLHLFEVKNEYVSKTGLIGLCCGIVGFILTFVYVILNGLVYTTSDTDIYKMDDNLAFAELKGDKYECYYFSCRYFFPLCSTLIRETERLIESKRGDIDRTPNTTTTRSWYYKYHSRSRV